MRAVISGTSSNARPRSSDSNSRGDRVPRRFLKVLDPGQAPRSGAGGKITKSDVLAFLGVTEPGPGAPPVIYDASLPPLPADERVAWLAEPTPRHEPAASRRRAATASRGCQKWCRGDLTVWMPEMPSWPSDPGVRGRVCRLVSILRD